MITGSLPKTSEVVGSFLGTTSGSVVDITSVLLDVTKLRRSLEEHRECSANRPAMKSQLYEALHISTSRLILLVRLKIRHRRSFSDCSLTEVNDCV